MPAAVAFYRRLGLQFDSDSDVHAESALAGGVRLMLDTEESVRSFTPDWAPPSGSPRASLAFQCDNPAEVDAGFHELVQAGYRGSREPLDAMWGQRYATTLDPDGNAIDLHAALPATRG